MKLTIKSMYLLSDNFDIVEKTQFTDLQRVEKNFWETIRNRRKTYFSKIQLLFLFELETFEHRTLR